MPRTRGQRQNFTFNKGWNTEASPLTFPENTATDLDNVVLDVDGSIRRRMGVVCESATSTRYQPEIASAWEYIAVGFFKWTNVAGSGDFNLLVSQKGTTLQFNGEDGTDYGSLSFASRVITARASQGPNEVLETASGLGYFFCCGPSIDPFYLEYDVSTDTVSLTGFEIQIRDFDGVDDGLAVDTRPTTLSAAHEYNLRNQGWPESFPCITDGASKSTDDTVGFTFNQIGSYPSNADVIYYGKTSTGADESELDRYNPTVMVKNVFGTTPAPKGKYIFNAFNIDRNSIVAGATSEIVNNRPRAVGFHNGRVFFAGVNAVGYTGKVYYSQQLTNIDKIGKCYQDNDPTSEIFNDLLATDGGEIDIPNCGNILRIEEGPAGIVVFASNGMWEITGQEGKFSATEFFVRKVTDIGCAGGNTVVNADGTFYYWSDAGIVGTTRDQVSGNLSADIITQTSIQLGYLLFGGPQRRGAKGVWIRGEKKVVWLYSTDTTYDNVSNRFKYNGVLVLDTILGAFYKYSISDFNVGAAPYISGIVESASTVTITSQEDVTVGAVTVTAGGTDVTIPVDGTDADTVTSTWKLQVVRPTIVGTTTAYGIDFATFSSRTFTDWYFEDNAGVDYTSFLETGFDYGGQAMYDKKPTYVYTYMSRISKSNLDGGYYNIPDPTTAVVVEASFCSGYDNYVQGTFTGTGGADLGHVTFDPTGTYATVSSPDNNRQFSGLLDTAYDFSSFTQLGNAQASAFLENRTRFNADGTEAWIMSQKIRAELNHVTGYATPYSITGIDGVDFTLTLDYDFGTWTSDFIWSTDGTKLWVIRTATQTAGTPNNDCVIEKYTASTAYDATTLTYDSDTYDVSTAFLSGEAVAEDITYVSADSFDFNSDGTQLQLNCSDPFDQLALPKLYFFDLPVPYDLDGMVWTGDYYEIDTSSGIGGVIAAQQVGVGDQLRWAWWYQEAERLFYSVESTSAVTQLDQNCGITDTGVNWIEYFNADPVSGKLIGIDRSGFSTDNHVWTTYDTTDVDTPFVNSTHTQKGAFPETTCWGVFNDDGTEFWHDPSFTMTRYDLSTPYDLTTAVASATTASFSFGNRNPAIIRFLDSGTKMFVVTTSSIGSQAKLQCYQLSTAYDISTASTLGSVKEFYWGQFTSGGTMSEDGTTIYGCYTDNINRYIVKATLSTPYDCSTVGASSDLHTDENYDDCIIHPHDSTKLIALYNKGSYKVLDA